MFFKSNIPDILTLEQTAKYLQVHYNTVYKLVRSGKLPAAKIGKEYRILKTDILAYLEKSKNVE